MNLMVIFGIVSQGYSTGSEMKRVVHRRNEKKSKRKIKKR